MVPPTGAPARREKKTVAMRMGFLVGFSLAFFFFEEEGGDEDSEKEEQIHEIRQFALALSIDRPSFPSIYDTILLFHLVLGFFMVARVRRRG